MEVLRTPMKVYISICLHPRSFRSISSLAVNSSVELASPDCPETPAPVFAARALKSAIFGTPAPRDDDTFEVAKAGNSVAQKSRPRSSSMSPTKRGILMTPGTATARRKTVTFGTNTEHELKKNSKSGIPDDCPGKFPSPWVPKSDDTLPVTRRTRLTRTLENARESTKKSIPVKIPDNQDEPEVQQAAKIELPSTQAAELKSQTHTQLKGKKAVEPGRPSLGTSEAEDADLDFTVDLNQPRSQSGRHWKREYEKYHEEAQERMGHLIRYKELAKEYAKMKDDEAMEMREQLEQEQQNIINMERYIARLISAIDDRTKSGDSEITPELTKELARQTALAVQYKEQVDQFRAALEQGGVVQSAVPNGRCTDTPSKTERALLEARQDLEKARDQLKETDSLRSEAKRLKLDVLLSERKTAKFKEENLLLERSLEQCKADLERSEKERKALEEKSRKREDTLRKLETDYDLLKELAKRQRSDADLQLQQRHDQITTLRKELSSTRYIADSSESERLVRTLQQKISAHDRIVQEYETQIARLRVQEARDLDQFNLLTESSEPKSVYSPRRVLEASTNASDFEDKSHGRATSAAVSHKDDETGQQDQTINVDHFLNSMVSELQTPTGRRGHAQKENRSMLPTYTYDATPRSSQSVLREITNSTSKFAVPATNESFMAVTPGLSKIFSDLSLQSPAVALPELLTSRTTCQGKLANDMPSKDSPRPSRLNFEYSPAKPRTVSSLAREPQILSRASSLSNASSLRSRTTLPPERAAAARARLEQRTREKLQKRMREAE